MSYLYTLARDITSLLSSLGCIIGDDPNGHNLHNEAPLGRGGINQEYTFTLQVKASAQLTLRTKIAKGDHLQEDRAKSEGLDKYMPAYMLDCFVFNFLKEQARWYVRMQHGSSVTSSKDTRGWIKALLP